MSFLSNKKLRHYWYDRVTKLILELGAVSTYYDHDCSLKQYELQTRAGLMTIHPPNADSKFISVCARFADVEAANEKFGSRGWHHNQHSGICNIHPSVGEGKSIKPCDRIPHIDEALDQVRRHFESVL